MVLYAGELKSPKMGYTVYYSKNGKLVKGNSDDPVVKADRAKNREEAKRYRKLLEDDPVYRNTGAYNIRGMAHKLMAQQDMKPASIAKMHSLQRPPPRLQSRNFPENEMQMKIHDANVNAQKPNPLDPQK